jgi:hypothetical protein
LAYRTNASPVGSAAVRRLGASTELPRLAIVNVVSRC